MSLESKSGPDTRRASGRPFPSNSLEPPQVSAYKFSASPNASGSYDIDAYVSPPQQVDTGGAITLTLWERASNWIEGWKKALPQQGIVSKFKGQNERSSRKFSFELPPVSYLNTMSGEAPHAPNPSSHPAASYDASAMGLKPPEDIVFKLTQYGEPQTPGSLGSSSKLPYQAAITPPRVGGTRSAKTYGDLSASSLVDDSTRSKDVINNRNGSPTLWAPSLPASGSISNLAPPVFNDPTKSPSVYHELPVNYSKSFSTKIQQLEPGYYDIDNPTCSLNLVCYRSGADGCDLQQIHCTLRSKFSNKESFTKAVTDYPNLVYSDVEFFHEMRRLYRTRMSNMFRRFFSLKSLRAFKILAYTPTTRPVVVPFDDFVLQEMMYAYRNPDRLENKDDWVSWVFRLRRKDKRHAVEFV